MTREIVLLCTAAMLVSAYLMVGLKSLVMTIKLYAVQSFLLGAVAVAMAFGNVRHHLLATAALTIVLKTFLIPWFLIRLIDRVGIRREVEPFINVPASLLACGGLSVVALRVSARVIDGSHGMGHHVVGAALAMTFIGVFLMATRKKAITQILALLSIENAIFLIALAATPGMPMLVELGISFDVILAVLVLGMLVHRIVDRFESMDVSRLSKLKG